MRITHLLRLLAVTQAALLEQMFRESGFFARYSDAEFRKAMLVALP